MKKRTLLLGPCGGKKEDCKKGGKKHKAWEAISNVVNMVNGLSGNTNHTPEKDAQVSSILNAMGVANPEIGTNIKGMRDAINKRLKLMEECGFKDSGSKPVK